jgi:hypothetical protein
MRRAVVALAVMLPLVAACGRGADRNDARDDFVQQLVDNDFDRDMAECVVDAFFHGRTDQELQAFLDRDELTDDERTEFANLAVACNPD